VTPTTTRLLKGLDYQFGVVAASTSVARGVYSTGRHSGSPARWIAHGTSNRQHGSVAPSCRRSFGVRWSRRQSGQAVLNLQTIENVAVSMYKLHRVMVRAPGTAGQVKRREYRHACDNAPAWAGRRRWESDGQPQLAFRPPRRPDFNPRPPSNAEVSVSGPLAKAGLTAAGRPRVSPKLDRGTGLDADLNKREITVSGAISSAPRAST